MDAVDVVRRPSGGRTWQAALLYPSSRQGTRVPGSRPVVSGIPFKGVFFSTFFGGHETSWGPKKEVHAYFSNFKVSTTKL